MAKNRKDGRRKFSINYNNDQDEQKQSNIEVGKIVLVHQTNVGSLLPQSGVCIE